ncbi:MAG: response regulator [Planctomycetota bacterium]|jgi:DNA-binding NtrC family response regulator
MVWNRSKFGFGAEGCQSRAEQQYGSAPNREGCSEVNVLASQASWAWPAALREIFRPRGVNLLVAENANQFLSIIKTRRIHTTIIDVDSDKSNALATIRIIRMDYPLMPCILLSSRPQGEGRHESLLGNALKLNVFSVIDKPVEMGLLLEQLNRLFTRRYDSDIFSR